MRKIWIEKKTHHSWLYNTTHVLCIPDNCGYKHRVGI